MTNSTSTEAQSPEWTIEQVSKTDYLSHVRVTCPSGFKMELDGVIGCLDMLANMALREVFVLPGDTSRLFISSSGSVFVRDTDKWMNPGFEYDTLVCEASRLAFVLKGYIAKSISARD